MEEQEAQYFTLMSKTLLCRPEHQGRAKEEEVKDLSLNIGGTQTERNAAWLATSVQDEYLQVAEKSADYKEGDAFPEKTAVVYKADKEDIFCQRILQLQSRDEGSQRENHISVSRR